MNDVDVIKPYSSHTVFTIESIHPLFSGMCRMPTKSWRRSLTIRLSASSVSSFGTTPREPQSMPRHRRSRRRRLTPRRRRHPPPPDTARRRRRLGWTEHRTKTCRSVCSFAALTILCTRLQIDLKYMSWNTILICF